MQIIIENVRPFVGLHEVPLRDFTILVGENSTGKSTFLAVLAAIGYRERFPERPAFNESPFNLGNYETIASRRSDGKRSEESFKVGFQRGSPPGETRSVATYTGKSGQVSLSHFEARAPRGKLTMDRKDDYISGEAELSRADQPNIRLSFAGAIPRFDVAHSIPGIFFVLPSAQVLDGAASEPEQGSGKLFQEVMSLWIEATNPTTQILPLAPIRSKPSRTYDQVDAPFQPEGGHVPLRLARILGRGAHRKERNELSKALDQFGQDSGLFSHVQIKPLSSSPSAPFEMIVTVGGQRVNIADVGYGVSQVLPVIVESVLASRSTVLLQQPEVHLHPRAQAALGTFFTRVLNRTQIVVETHSDYLIDRVRQEVAASRLSPESVLILYFERKDTTTTIHPIHLDSLGNLIDAPQCYREFFIHEELRLLSRGAN